MIDALSSLAAHRQISSQVRRALPLTGSGKRQTSLTTPCSLQRVHGLNLSHWSKSRSQSYIAGMRKRRMLGESRAGRQVVWSWRQCSPCVEAHDRVCKTAERDCASSCCALHVGRDRPTLARRRTLLWSSGKLETCWATKCSSKECDGREDFRLVAQ